MQKTIAAILLALLPAMAFAVDTDDAIANAVAGEHRSAENRARDTYRHPRETLEFFGLRPDMTVVEMWPGSGWYTEILAATLKDRGRLYAAQYSANPVAGYQRRYLGAFLTMLGQNPDLYRDVIVTTFYPPYFLDIAPRGSADMVLTFRNLHNWLGEQRKGGVSASLAFKVMYDALKPGGILGITDHRWPEGSGEADPYNSGYIKASEAIALAELTGFKLVESSEINANPRDTHDHKEGVWTLPPSLALGDKDKDKYLAIGESDRFTLKFIKPVEPAN
ncbi:MAG: class I SAM-dependent methyltransferase [Pseudomonadales bacterium]|nr:class I SAM-dependent methyltransferase [Halioglobus sp.]MCP5130631.1 class I SAM-dependent methyltransferase [Pseudomonadales bacterium]